MNYKKIQKAISIIPFVSTVIILIATIHNLKCQNAPFRKWIRFNLTFFVTGTALSILDAIFVNVNAPMMQVVITTLVLAIANFCFIDLQVIPTTPNKGRYQTQMTGFSKRGIILLIGLIGAVLSFLVVSLFLGSDSTSGLDANGPDDTSLSFITLDEILATVDNYSATWVQDSCKGQKTHVVGEMEDSDYDNISFRCKQVDGIRTLQSTKVATDSVTLNIESVMKSGNMEIVILLDDTYYCHVKTNCKQTIELNDIAGKTIIVRMAAESAEVDLTVTRSYESLS